MDGKEEDPKEGKSIVSQQVRLLLMRPQSLSLLRV